VSTVIESDVAVSPAAQHHRAAGVGHGEAAGAHLAATHHGVEGARRRVAREAPAAVGRCHLGDPAARPLGGDQVGGAQRGADGGRGGIAGSRQGAAQRGRDLNRRERGPPGRLGAALVDHAGGPAVLSPEGEARIGGLATAGGVEVGGSEPAVGQAEDLARGRLRRRLGRRGLPPGRAAGEQLAVGQVAADAALVLRRARQGVGADHHGQRLERGGRRARRGLAGDHLGDVGLEVEGGADGEPPAGGRDGEGGGVAALRRAGEAEGPGGGGEAEGGGRGGAVHEQDVAAQLEWRADEARALRELGFTTALATPAAGVWRGQGALLALGAVEAAQARAQVMTPRASQHLSMHAPRRGDALYPVSTMGAVALARQSLYDARWYRGAMASNAPERIEPIEIDTYAAPRRDGCQVNQRVGRPADRVQHDERVGEGLGREDRRGPHVVRDHGNGSRAGCFGDRGGGS